MPREKKCSELVTHAARLNYYMLKRKITMEEIDAMGNDTDKIKAYANLIKTCQQMIEYGLEEMIPMAIERAIQNVEFK